MTLTAPAKQQPPRPPLLLFISCLTALVLLTGFIGYSALRNGDAFTKSMSSMQQARIERINELALPNQLNARAGFEADQQYLNQVTIQYRKLHRLLAISVTVLGVMILFAFLIYRYALVMPLRTLIHSCRELAQQNLRGVIWGMERPDLYGDLARSISDIRKEVSQLTDMTVEGPDGTNLVRFSGRGGAIFNTLIGDLQSHIKDLQQNSETMRQNMEEESATLRRTVESQAEAWQHKVQSLEDTVLKNSNNLHDAVEISRKQMEEFNSENRSIRVETSQLVAKFRDDLEVIGEITAATGQRVAQTLSTLSASDRDIRESTQLTLKSSESFSKHAADLTEKLVAATTLMRASGKVMMETTEAARTRFLEAVKSLETQDQTLRAFLSNTADKTEQIAGLYDSLSGSTQRVHDTVDRFDTRMGDAMMQFDTRMSDFTGKSDAVLEGISASGMAMGQTSNRLQATHDTMAASLEAMHGHTDMMAQVLTTIRNEYATTMESMRTTLGEATPAIAQLKDAGNNIQSQLKEEWTQYSKQSHALLVALEQDARAMHTRSELVASNTEKLMANISTHSTHLSTSASQFDLQVANLSQRIEAAASSVLRSNEGVTEATTAQIGEIHEAVSDMMQRLGILTQLTGTLGGVAGQLGSLVPTLSEMQNLPRASAAMAMSSNNPGINAKIEQMGAEFGHTLRGMRTEFDTVRTQISRWVDTLSGGYQRLAQQIGGIDAALETKLESVIARLPAPSEPLNPSDIAAKLAPSLLLIHETLTDEATYSMKMGETVDTLRADLDVLREQATTSSGTLQSVRELLAQGFAQLLRHEQEISAAIPAVTSSFDVTRMESASAALENMIASMQGTSFNLIEKLERVTQELDKAASKIAG